MPLKLNQHIPNTLSELSVKDQNENTAQLKSFWSDNDVLILFIRHFGCIGCTAQMDAIAPRLQEINALKVKLVIIGNGAPNFIEGFIEKFQLQDKPISIYTDPSLKTYEKAELRRSIWTMFSFRTLRDYIVSFSKGIGQGKIQGDNWQQGGALLVDSNGVLRYHFQNKSAAGIADSNEIIEAIQQMKIS